MGVTISTHNGSAVAREHNIRNPKVVSKESHIDMNGYSETWIDEPVRQAYERLFSEAVAKYNTKQSRPERQIKSYYNDICKDSKKHPVYEMIIGIYGKKEDGSPICSAEQGKEIMSKFVEDWRERNPNLELIGAYYHADEEGEPHVHLDYIPVAHGYTRGLETQTGLVRALGEQGFLKAGKATAQIQWEKRENYYLQNLCEAMGLEVEHPHIEGRKHLETDVLKLQKRVEELEQAEKEAVTKYLEADERTQITEERLKAIEGKILKREEINAIKGKRTLTGALKGVTYVEYLSLKKTALEVQRMEKECKKLISERDSARKYAKNAVEEGKRKSISADLERTKEMLEYMNQNQLLKKTLGIPEDANYDQTKRLLQKQGLVSVKNKNLGR